MQTRIRAAFCAALCLALTAVSPAWGLSGDKAVTQYLHQSWNNMHGLPQNTVTAITQTGDGYLWLGTLEGLVRFDGIRFTAFNTRNTPEFRHNIVVALLVDSQDRLWIATSGGGLLRRQGDHFVRLGTEHGLPSDQVSALYQDDRGRVWIGTDGGGLAWYSEGEIHRREEFDLFGKHIRALEQSRAGIWIGSEKGLGLLHNNGNLSLFDETHGLSDHSVRALLARNQTSLWVSTDRGLDRLEYGVFIPVEGGVDAEGAMIVDMLEDDHGNLWLATDGEGVKRWQQGRVERFTSHEGLSNDHALALFESRDGSLWVGTNLGGLNQLKDGRLTTFTRSHGLPINAMRAVLETPDGALWVGSEGGGLVRFHEGELSLLDQRDGLPDNTVYSLEPDGEGGLWIGTGAGLAHWRDGRISQHGGAMTVLALQREPGRGLWIGTYGEGLKRYDGSNLSDVLSGQDLGSDTVNTLLLDDSANLWIGTRGGGLGRLAGNALQTWTTADGLSDDMVFALHEDGNGAIWVGTYGGGLNRFANGSFVTIDEQQGLFDNVIHRILEDEQGNFWMSCNRGIFSVPLQQLNAVADGSRQTVESTAFGQADGMRNIEANGGDNAGTRSRDGYLWFPSVEGLVRVSPDAGIASSAGARLLLENILLDGTPVSRRGSPSFPPGAKNLEIQYTATDLHAPGEVEFFYRLKGLDDHWVPAGNRRVAWYSQLPHGDYEFLVYAQRGHPTQWRSETRGFSFSVEPQFHETPRFRAAVAAAIAVLLYLVYRLMVHRLKYRNARLEALISARTAELEQANEQLSQMANEDSLTGLLNRRAFDRIIGEEYRRAERAGLPLAVLLLDIDFFKQYNDIYGHPAGDDCLRAIAENLREACGRAGETVARYGGEEVAIILPATGLEKALDQAENLRGIIEGLALPHQGSSVANVVTASIGVASGVPGGDGSPAAFLSAADTALYRAKALGRNRVEASRLDTEAAYGT